MKKKLSLVIAVLCFVSVFAFCASATDSCELYMGSNVGDNTYYMHGKVVKSYLTKCDNGNYMKVQYGCYEAVESSYSEDEYYEGDSLNEVVIIYYTSDFKFISGKRIKPVLPIFGGFYETKDNYYIISGQNNPDEKADVECFNIAKYDKNWNFIKSVGLKDCNTTVPFGFGTVRVASSGDTMVIRTCHQMYTSSDGLRHQANVTIVVKMSTMEITQDITTVGGGGYVSHSFNQFLLVDERNRSVTLDHGDGYPRSLVMQILPTDLIWNKADYKHSVNEGIEDLVEPMEEWELEDLSKEEIESRTVGETKWATYIYWGDVEKIGRDFPENIWEPVKEFSFLDIPGKTGDNYTGCTVGGFELTDSSYILAGTKTDYNNYEKSKTENIFISVFDKKAVAEYDVSDREAIKPTATLTQITNYKEGTESASTPHLVKIDGNSLLLMWRRKGKLYYQELNGKGERVGQLYEVEGKLSDCEPIIVDSKIMWYTWKDAETTFYFIDTRDISSYSVKTITAKSHQYKISKTIKKATFEKKGKAEYVCTVCGKKKTDFIPEKYIGSVTDVKIKTTKNKVTISWPKAQYAKKYVVEIGTEYWNRKTYKTKKNKITVKNLSPGTKYILYICGVNGKYSGFYEGPEFFATESEAPVISVKVGKKKAEVSFKGVKGASKYEISCSLNKKFKKNVKNVTVKNKKTVKKTIGKLRKGKTYYFRARAFTTFGGKKLYSAYSKVKSVKIR